MRAKSKSTRLFTTRADDNSFPGQKHRRIFSLYGITHFSCLSHSRFHSHILLIVVRETLDDYLTSELHHYQQQLRKRAIYVVEKQCSAVNAHHYYTRYRNIDRVDECGIYVTKPVAFSEHIFVISMLVNLNSVQLVYCYKQKPYRIVNSGDSGLKARDIAVSDWEKWCWGCYQFTCGFSREASRLYVHVVCFRYILVCRELLPLLSSIPNPNLNVIETKRKLGSVEQIFCCGRSSDQRKKLVNMIPQVKQGHRPISSIYLSSMTRKIRVNRK